ncbi:chaperone hsp31 [Lipomyces doorenjongii]
MTLPRRALISITSAHATLFQGKETTGVFISEALHPYKVLTAAGFEVHFTSETGTNLQKIAAQVWANGGIVSAVCHGPALFANLLDPATNEPIIKGKTITGFTTEAEITMGIMEELQSWGNDMIDGMAAKLGANYTRAQGIWDDYHVVDGRLVTGQNPASARSTAQAAVEAFEKL